MKIDILARDRSEFELETSSKDTFSEVFKKFRIESGHTIEKLSARSGVSIESINKYIAGHSPTSREILVKLCIGLGLCPQKSEYLFSLAHLSIGCDAASSVYKVAITLAFVSGLGIKECNELIATYGFEILE